MKTNKNIKELSNSELNIYKKELEFEFETLKNKISDLCEELKKVENKYNSIELEFKIRQNNIY